MAGRNKRLIALVIGVIIITVRAGWCDDKLNIAVSHPWLALLTSFIGGTEVNVIPIRIWNSNGDIVMSDKGRVLRELEDGAKVIALDEEDARSSGLFDAGKSSRARKNFTIHYLYSPFPLSINSLPDPSVLPFVAQRVLTALSDWDAVNYPNYQRRLAEFQARMSSSVLVGQVLKDSTVCDMSGASGVMLQAAGCRLIRPEELEQWGKGNFAGLREYLDNNKAQGITTMIDDDTPAVLKRYLSGRSDVFRWERPPLDRDYPTFLQEQYISLWQKIVTKPLPGMNKRH